MKFQAYLLAGAIAVGGLVATQASAAQITDRDSAYFITFSGGLDTASTHYSVTATLPSGGSDDTGGALTFKTGFQNFTFSTTGTVTTDFTTPVAGSSSEVLNLYNGGDGGLFNFAYDTANGPDFTSSWTASSVANGHQVLAFGGVGDQGYGGCGSALVDTGGIFTCEVFIQGYHPAGTGVGDGYITNLADGYNLISDFVYNADINATIVGVSTGNYDGTNPSLGFNIVGGAVPEPATWATMLMGFGGLGAAIRSRRAKRAATA